MIRGHRQKGIEELLAAFGRILDQAIAFDHFEAEPGADHVAEVSAPGRIDSARQAKAVFFDFIKTWPGHHAADLCFLPEYQQVRQDIEMFATPFPSCCPHPALDFIKDQQNVLIICNLAELAQPFGSEVIVTSLPLNRLDDNPSHVCSAFLEDLANFLFATLLV